MPLRSLFPHQQQQQQQLHHNHHQHHHRRQEQRCHHGLRQRPLLLSSASSYSSSFLPSALLSAGCCAVIFLASAIAATDIDPRRQMMETSDPRSLQGKDDHHQHHQLHHLHPQHHQPLSDGPGSGGRGVGGGPRMSTPSTKEQREQQRRAKETHIIEQIKMVILNATGQENKPLNGSLNRTGKDYQEAMRGFGNNFNFGQLPKGGAGGGGGGQGGLNPPAQGNPRRPMEVTNKIKEFADEVPNLIGVDGAVQFVLHPKQTPGYNGSQRVINATMKVLVRLNRHDQTPTGGQQQRQSRRRRRRITIVAYLLDDTSAAADAGRQKLGVGAAGTSDPYLPIAQLTVLVRKTNWHKVLLPTTIVQRVLDSDDKVLRLRVVCMECNDETEVVMTPRRTRKKVGGRKSTRAGRLGAGGRGGGRGGGGGEDGPVVEKSSLLVDDGTSFATERKSLRGAPPVGEGGGSRRSPVLIVSTRSSSRARKTG